MRGVVASGEPAVAVPCDHRPAQGRGRHRGPSADVQRFGSRPHHDAPNRGIAREPTRRPCRHAPRVIELGHPRAPTQRVDADRDGEMGALPGNARPLSAIQPLAADLPEAIRSTLRRRAQVLLDATRSCLGVLDGAQGREQALAVHRIQISVDAHHPS